MLVGTIPPTSGTVEIFGYDVSNPADIKNLRSMFGVCLQQDILFDDLNAQEHLQFFGGMKGIPFDKLTSEVLYFIKLKFLITLIFILISG